MKSKPREQSECPRRGKVVEWNAAGRRVRSEQHVGPAVGIKDSGELASYHYAREVDVDTGEASPWHKYRVRPLCPPEDMGAEDPPGWER